MSATSTIPAFKAALLARLQADGALNGVQVVRVDPKPAQPKPDQVIVAHARPTSALRDSTFPGGQSQASTGRLKREERYVVEVVCRVMRAINFAANAGAAAEDRAYELAAIVEANVAAWAISVPPFDSIVRFGGVIAMEDWQGADDQNREARVTVSIGCSQRIG